MSRAVDLTDRLDGHKQHEEAAAVAREDRSQTLFASPDPAAAKALCAVCPEDPRRCGICEIARGLMGVVCDD